MRSDGSKDESAYILPEELLAESLLLGGAEGEACGEATEPSPEDVQGGSAKAGLSEDTIDELTTESESDSGAEFALSLEHEKQPTYFQELRKEIAAYLRERQETVDRVTDEAILRAKNRKTRWESKILRSGIVHKLWGNKSFESSARSYDHRGDDFSPPASSRNICLRPSYRSNGMAVAHPSGRPNSGEGSRVTSGIRVMEKTRPIYVEQSRFPERTQAVIYTSSQYPKNMNPLMIMKEGFSEKKGKKMPMDLNLKRLSMTD